MQFNGGQTKDVISMYIQFVNEDDLGIHIPIWKITYDNEDGLESLKMCSTGFTGNTKTMSVLLFS